MADSRTQLSVELLCSDLIDGLDKSAAKVEEFSGRGTKAMNELSAQAKNMGTATKRVYDVLAKDMKKHEDAIRSVIPEYERLRQKQKSGEKMTRDELARLQQLSKEYKTHAGAIATCAKEAETLAKKFKNVKSAETQLRSVTPQLTHSFTNLALAIEGTKIALEAALGAIRAFGLEQEQQIAQLDALTRSTAGAYESYRLLNDTWRATNWDKTTVSGMAKAFVNLGLSAKEAADLVGTVGDAAAGLGVGEDGGKQIAAMLNDLKATGELEGRDVKRWQQMGIDLGKIFGEAFNMSAEEAMQAIKDGRVSGDDGFNIIANSLRNEFDGAMDKSKDNVIDALGDIQVNVETAAGEIGAALIRAFGIKGIAQDMVGETEKVVDAARGINDTGKVWESIENAFGKKTADTLETVWNVVGSLAGEAGFLYLGKQVSDVSGKFAELQQVADISKTFDSYDKLKSKLSDIESEWAGLIECVQGSRPEYLLGKDEEGKKLEGQYKAVYNEIEKTKAKMLEYGNISSDKLTAEQRLIVDSIKEWQNKKSELEAVSKEYAEQDDIVKNLSRQAGSGLFGRTKEQEEAYKKLTEERKKLVEVGERMEKMETALGTAQETALATMAKEAAATKEGAKATKALTAAKVAEVGVWNAATTATTANIRALYAQQIATVKATFSLNGLKTAWIDIKAAALTSMKAIAIAIAQFLITPLGAAIAAGAVLIGTFVTLYTQWKQFKRETEKPIINGKAAEELGKIDFNARGTTSDEDIDKINKLVEASKLLVEEDSRLGEELRKLQKDAKNYATELSIGAISEQEYAKKMDEINKKARELQGELQKLTSRNLLSREMVELNNQMSKTTVTADNFGKALNNISKIAHSLNFDSVIKGKVESCEQEMAKLKQQIDETQRKINEGNPDPAVQDALLDKLSKLQAKYKELADSSESYRKSSADLKSQVDEVKKTIADLAWKQQELIRMFNDGEISEEEYRKEMENLATQADAARVTITSVSSSVNIATQAMADGIITAGEYAKAISQIAMATAKVTAGQQGLAKALESGDQEAIQYWKSYIASASAEVAYEGQQIRDAINHVKTYGKDGRGTTTGSIKSGGYTLGDPKETKKKSGGGSKNTDDKDELALLKIKQENAKYELELAQKVAEAKKANEVELAKSLQNLYAQTGAKHAEIEQKRVVAQKQTELELLKLRDSYAKQRLAAEQSLQTKEYELSKADTEKKKQAAQEQIAAIKKSIADMNKNEETDAIAIKFKADVNEFSQDLANKINDAMKNIQWAKDGVFGSMMKNAEQEFETAAQNIASKYDELLNRLQKARQNADMAEMMAVMDGFKASGDALNEAGNIFTSSQLLGVSEGDLATKAEAISSLYQVISQAMTTAASQEIAANNAAKESAEEHARSIKALQDWGKSYLGGVGKEMGNAFAAWVTGAKSAKEAFGEMLQELIKNCITLLAQWAAVYALLLACGTNPHDASRGASKMVLGIDAKKNGGYISGPGGPRDDKAGVFALSDGEYVLNAHAVDAIGKGNLDYMNSTGRIPTGSGSGGGTTSNGFYNGGGGDTINVSVSALDAQSVESWLLGSGLAQIKQAFKNDQRNFNASYGVF